MARKVELRVPDGRMAFGDVPEHIDERLQAAVAARGTPDRCEELLWEAHRMGPRVLPVFFALYKFYVSRQRFSDAQRVALIGLEAAAWEGGFGHDWRAFTPDVTDWTAVGPARFTLFTLKALAFIALRRDRAVEARPLIDRLRELDPGDQVGWGVVSAMLDGAEREG